ncbi:MAG: glycosyltransferase [Flavobacteriales bacterium]|nr:D-inositol-3-phosphate glycosyltransferase [Flavobacteriales bacterium]MCC6576614.1 glycosyltransferase [Flavobacteriales bacterium]
MRIALVHDWLAVQGGAERVTRALVDLFDPDVFALVDFLSPQARQEVLGGRRAHTTFIQHLPFARRHFRHYLPLFPAAIERLDLRGYDLVLSASYAVAKGVRTRPGQPHLCYVHTPMRYAWVMEEAYLRDHGMQGLRGLVLRRVLRRLRRWDLASTARVTCLLANSHNTAQRIRACYGREADVVHPPVDLDAFTPGPAPREHYLAVSRLVPYKRVDRIIEAFRTMPERRLIVCGDGPERDRLRQRLPANVRLAGEVPHAELVHLLRGARALIAAAEEDFGLTPLEANACGTPVLALAAGGYLETVVEGRTGLFFPTADAAAIRAAVEHFERSGVTADVEALRRHAGRFGCEVFRTAMRAAVDRCLHHATP